MTPSLKTRTNYFTTLMTASIIYDIRLVSFGVMYFWTGFIFYVSFGLCFGPVSLTLTFFILNRISGFPKPRQPNRNVITVLQQWTWYQTVYQALTFIRENHFGLCRCCWKSFGELVFFSVREKTCFKFCKNGTLKVVDNIWQL